MLALLLQTLIAIWLVAYGLYGLHKTGVAKLGPFKADRSTNRAGVLAMMFIYLCIAAFAFMVLLRLAALAFPD